MDLDKLFDDMTAADKRTKETILCRVFGLMESRQNEGKQMDPTEFFGIVEKMIKPKDEV